MLERRKRVCSQEGLVTRFPSAGSQLSFAQELSTNIFVVFGGRRVGSLRGKTTELFRSGGKRRDAEPTNSNVFVLVDDDGGLTTSVPAVEPRRDIRGRRGTDRRKAAPPECIAPLSQPSIHPMQLPVGYVHSRARHPPDDLGDEI
ncbi:uncharacterized protein LOC143210532 [Lasioglossum baleicum]|uniref:uncharacterized protein LOC143210532 n=1 Tax=Lasioglossum baleicum TaxID=434251 RepID=UPI003FCE6E3F